MVSQEQQLEPIMKECKYTSRAGLLALLVAFMGTGEVKSEVQQYFVRATKYHRTDSVSDHWTRNGRTSTQIRLPQDDRVVTDPNHIGNVAVDPDHVLEGSLVFEIETKRFFISTTGGTAVIDRRSAQSIAQTRGLGPKYSEALVFDFYFPYEIVENHYTKCIVVPHVGKTFRTLYRSSQEQRLNPEFWIPRLTHLYEESRDEREKQNLRVMILRLREINSSKNKLLL